MKNSFLKPTRFLLLRPPINNFCDSLFTRIHNWLVGMRLIIVPKIIKNDPSIPFIYFSFILIIFGTIISLIPTNQLWILVNKESQKLSIGGLSNKNLVGFKKEFLKLSDEIKNF